MSTGGSSTNRYVAVYDEYGKFMKHFNSIRDAKVTYNYTGIAKNINHNSNAEYKKISSINLIFVEFKNFSDIKESVLIQKKRPIVLYDICEDKILMEFKSNIEHKEYLGSLGLNIINSSGRISQGLIVKYTNGHIFCYKDEIDIMLENKSELELLCCFDGETGEFISKDMSKTYCAERYNLNPMSINNCSRSNNCGVYKRHLRKYAGYIFKHYKLKDIPKIINVKTGDIIS